jgi:hypothetical protein
MGNITGVEGRVFIAVGNGREGIVYAIKNSTKALNWHFRIRIIEIVVHGLDGDPLLYTCIEFVYISRAFDMVLVVGGAQDG